MCLSCTGLLGELEHLKITTRLINEMSDITRKKKLVSTPLDEDCCLLLIDKARDTDKTYI